RPSVSWLSGEKCTIHGAKIAASKTITTTISPNKAEGRLTSSRRTRMRRLHSPRHGLVPGDDGGGDVLDGEPALHCEVAQDAIGAGLIRALRGHDGAHRVVHD